MFFELLRVSLGTGVKLSHVPSRNEWIEIYDISHKQAVEGVMLAGVERLPVDQRPPQALLLQWIGVMENIKAQNLLLNRRSMNVTALFADAGFRSCILKGQGNARMYINPLIRKPGDIDIWVDGSRKNINSFVTARCPEAHDGEKHIDFPYFRDVVVEVHYKPVYTSIPRYNKRMQAWVNEQANLQFSNQVTLLGDINNSVCVPTTTFNVVYQMSHIMGHFFVEGIGMKQFVDYFYVLKKIQKEGCSSDFEKLFKHLGLLKFARGVMWIEHECLGLGKGFLLFEQDYRIGKIILKEMLSGGNFGQYDERYKIRKLGLWTRGFTDCFRLLTLAIYFPQESLWKILRKVENQKWKLRRVIQSVKR